MRIRNVAVLIASFFGVIIPCFYLQSVAFADTPSTAELLQAQIKERAQKMADLEKEIQQYQQELNKTAEQRQTLERDVKSLDVSRRKISANINLTTEKIKAAESTINEIQTSIQDKERRIALNTRAVAGTLRAQYEADEDSFLETVLGEKDIKDIWAAADRMVSVQTALGDDVQRLQSLRNELNESKRQAEGTKQELSSLKQNLDGQKQSLDVTRLEKSQILTSTKNQETAYQKMLREKQAAHDQFDRELADLEAKLKFSLDLSAIPKAGSGILSWPFENLYMAQCSSFSRALGNTQCITQYFGNTPFAQLGAYKGKGHNGIDFRAPTGTIITAAASGRITATGDSGSVRGCYSYGRWVLIEHETGISTLYAHLSKIDVQAGQPIARGDRVGFSGSTGYATGPHLHFGVYVTKGIKVQTLGGRTPCANATIPVAATEAYLNPLAYL